MSPRRLAREQSRLIEELIDRGFVETAAGFDPEVFGNTYVNLARGSLRVYVGWERGEEYVVLGGSSDAGWNRNGAFDAVLWDAVASGSTPPHDLPPLADQVELILRRLDDFDRMVRDDPTGVEAALNDVGERRLFARLGMDRPPWAGGPSPVDQDT
jgi:hypothetical protein